MKGNQKVFITQVSVGFGEKKKKGISLLDNRSSFSELTLLLLLTLHLSSFFAILSLRPQIPPGRSLSFHPWKTKDLLLHSRNTYILLLQMLWQIINAPLLARTPFNSAVLEAPRHLGCRHLEAAPQLSGSPHHSTTGLVLAVSITMHTCALVHL